MSKKEIYHTTFCYLFLTTIIAIMPTAISAQNIQFSTYQPIEYKPVEPNMSILQRSLQQRENRRNQAFQKYLDLAQLINEKKTSISNDRETLIWFDENINSMMKDVEAALIIEDYASVINLATRHIGEIYSHTELIYRIQTYKEYQAIVKFVQERYDLTYQQKKDWLTKYVYKFVPIRNDMNEIIGAKEWIEIGGPNNTPVVIP